MLIINSSVQTVKPKARRLSSRRYYVDSEMEEYGDTATEYWREFRSNKLLKWSAESHGEANVAASQPTSEPAEIYYYEIPLGLFSRGKLYVRDCYKKLLPRFLDPKLQKVIVAGSPGVGKTCFILFLLKELFERDQVGDLKILTSGLFLGGDDFALFESDKVSFMGKLEALLLLMGNEVIYFADSSDKGALSQQAARTFVFASPQEDNVGSILELDHSYLFLPTWTLDELVAYNRIIQFPYPAGLSVQERYSIFGGKARYVFSSRNREYEELVECKLKTIEFTELLKLRDPFHYPQSYPYHLISINGIGPDYESCTIELASQWIAELVSKRFPELPTLPEFKAFFKQL